MIPKKHIKVLLFVLCGLIFRQVYGFDRQGVIYLESDNIKYDYKNGIVLYEGNVHGTQGPTELLADKMTVYYKKNKINKVIAIGQLAKYKTKVNNDKEYLNAAAKTITYHPLEGKVELIGQAEVIYKQNVFNGPNIYYDMNTQIITSHANKMSKSKITLEPIRNLMTNK